MAEPRILKDHVSIVPPVTADDIALFNAAGTNKIKSNGINIEEITKNGNVIKSTILPHVGDKTIHVTQADKDKWNNLKNYDDHVKNNVIHITEEDRIRWDSKETPSGAQAKANEVQTNLNRHAYDSTIHCSTKEKNKWNNTYSKQEINNMISAQNTGNLWKPAVNTFADLATVYPEPYDGWTVDCLDTDITYRFTGSAWIPISANSIPMATHTLDGKMSHQDKTKLDGIEDNANHYVFPEGPNCRVVTDDQIKYWNAKAENTVATEDAQGLMSITDKKKLDGIEVGATRYIEPDHFPATKITQDDTHRFVTDKEKDFWNHKASTLTATNTIDGLMSHQDKIKLDGIEVNANHYVHPDHEPASMIVESQERQFVSASDKAKWNNMLSKSNILFGQAKFGGLSGTTIEHNLDTENYMVFITITSRKDPDHMIWTVEKATNVVIVVCDNNVDTFDYTIIKMGE